MLNAANDFELLYPLDKSSGAYIEMRRLLLEGLDTLGKNALQEKRFDDAVETFDAHLNALDDGTPNKTVRHIDLRLDLSEALAGAKDWGAAHPRIGCHGRTNSRRIQASLRRLEETIAVGKVARHSNVEMFPRRTPKNASSGCHARFKRSRYNVSVSKKLPPNDPPADSFERLIRAHLEHLPGIGRRSAERLAYYILGQPRNSAMGLALAIRDVKDKLHPCEVCGDLTEKPRCAICDDPRRDATVICVVEWPRDLHALEKSGGFTGRYHVLMGRLSPLSGIDPKDLRIESLLQRVREGSVKELVLATSPTVEGDATASFVSDQAKAARGGIVVTRLARGLPAGSDLSFAQSGTLSDALKGRVAL